MPEEPETPESPDEKPESSEDGPGKNLIAQALFKSRTVFIADGIDPEMADKVCKQLWAYHNADPDAPITMFVNSPGGHVESGDMIHDMIRFIAPRVRMVGTGYVASAGALIYVAAEKEDRVCLPNTRFLLHQPAGGIMGVADDVAIQADEILKMRKRLNKIFADRCGQPLEKIENDTHRDFWLSADEAIAYGIVDRVVRSSSDLS